jgi:hypothetical protein
MSACLKGLKKVKFQSFLRTPKIKTINKDNCSSILLLCLPVNQTACVPVFVLQVFFSFETKQENIKL